jgi:hypothetical protein
MDTNVIERGGNFNTTPSQYRNWKDICVLLGYYAAYNDIFLPKFRDNLSVQYSGVKKSKRIGRFSRNVGKELSLYAA